MTQQLSDLVARLRRFDTSTISDACERSGHECHVVTDLAPLTTTAAIAGAAITVQLGPADETSGYSTRHLGTTAVEAATSDHVIVIDHRGRNDCAGWGGNLSRGARHRGCAGTIIDGAARDIDEAADLGYPIFARSATPLTARGRAVELATQTPIQIAGGRVDPGDYLIADSTGIVIIPQHAISDVLDAAPTIAAHEEQIAHRIDDGTPITEAMGRNYEQLLHDDRAGAE
jgi:regulator of RNase E activity RraA